MSNNTGSITSSELFGAPASGSSSSSIWDADADTGVDVEATPDNDTIFGYTNDGAGNPLARFSISQPGEASFGQLDGRVGTEFFNVLGGDTLGLSAGLLLDAVDGAGGGYDAFLAIDSDLAGGGSSAAVILRNNGGNSVAWTAPSVAPGSDLFFALPNTQGANGQVLASNGVDSTYWTTVATSGIWDTDGDTGIDCERTPDVDEISFYTGDPSVERMRLGGNGLRIEPGSVSGTATEILEIQGSSIGGDIRAKATNILGLPTQPGTAGLDMDVSGLVGSIYMSRNDGLWLESDGTALGRQAPIHMSVDSTEIVTVNFDSGSVPGYLGLSQYGAGAGEKSELRFFLGDVSSNYVGFKAPDAIPTSEIWTLPAADGTPGQVLSTNGANVLSWVGGAADSDWSGAATGMLYPTNITDNVAIGNATPTYTNRGLWVENAGAYGGSAQLRGSAARLELFSSGNAAGARAMDIVGYSDAYHIRLLDDGFSTQSAGILLSASSFILNDNYADVDTQIFGNSGLVPRVHADGATKTVGINTATPGSQLHVTDDTACGVLVSAFGNGAGDYPFWFMYRGRNVEAAPNSVLTGDILGSADFRAFDGTGAGDAGYIAMYANEDWSTGNTGSRLVLATTEDANATSVERVQIDDDGVVQVLTNYIDVHPKGTAAGDGGTVRFRELAASGTDYVGLSGPDAATATQDYKLPQNYPSVAGDALTCDGSGNMGWAARDLRWSATAAGTWASTSTFTVTDNATNQSIFATGRPIRFRQAAGTWRYAIITDYTTGTITVAGHPITNAAEMTEMEWGNFDRVQTLSFAINGEFADGASTSLIEDDLFTFFKWTMAKAYCVLISHRVTDVDTGASQPRVNLRVNGQPVSTSNTNAGRDVSTSWVDTVVDIAVANYDINWGEAIEISTDANGTNNDARSLSLQATFVFED